MKTIFYTISLALLIVFYSTSCKKEVEKVPFERNDLDNIFDVLDSNGDQAKKYLYGTYTLLPELYGRLNDGFLESATDDGVHININNITGAFRQNRVSSRNVFEANMWAQNYEGIRRVNVFLANIDRVPVRPSTLRPQMKAEARFLRAYFYFELLKRWGGVPVIKDSIYDFNTKINIARNTAGETFDYIISELNAAFADALPLAQSDVTWGMVSRGGIMALKSRVLLYRASPLYNTGNNTTYWSDAVNAAKQILDSNYYSLATNYITLFNSVRLTGTAREIIFTKIKTTGTGIETLNGPVGYVQGSGGANNPSQNLVDAYLVKTTGKRITETGSGYDPANPYANRDDRFAASVFYNGKSWFNRPVQTYEGGLDNPLNTQNRTRTGYYLRKFMGAFETSTSISSQTHNHILFRLGEIMLNYAEAENELNGPGATSSPVYQNLINIRKRAGVAAGNNALYGLPASATKEEMREIIRNERRIELAFEEHRFWDIRRWKIAETVMNQPVRGMKITNGPALTYAVFDVEQSSFDASKMYFYPIPFSEMQRNPSLTQNPNWN
ncbi:RagB/SusD family nutrient uptake outer membrane protein [Niabella aquatica]